MSDIDQHFDVVIVGAGIGGSALAWTLASNNLSVLLLEKSLEHKDVVRGEWLAPWGVKEATELGLTGIYMEAGAHRLQRHIGYSEFVPAATAEARALDMSNLPETPLCLGHPKTCNLLNSLAVETGVTFCRGITSLNVTLGTPPTIDFSWQGKSYSLRPRWIVGADGRNSVVVRQIGAKQGHDPEHHLFSGMLVEKAYDWPEDLQVVATEGDVHVLAFPQGEGKVRIYLGWPKTDRTRLLGPEGPDNFLNSWDIECVPQAAAIANSTPASPCIAYPNFDTWVDQPVKDGVVLIGDAAGHNDPIIGQGLSVAHRDVRLVRDAMINTSRWSTGMFDDYVSERAERMSRLRIIARISSIRDAGFGQEGLRLRHEIHDRMAQNPDFALLATGAFLGPEALPAELYSETFTEQIIGQPIWSDLP